MSSEPHRSHDRVYYWIFAFLTVGTILELLWPGWFKNDESLRWLLLGGLGVIAAIKASMVALYYMHLKSEVKLIWVVIITPIVLSIVMIIGLLPDAIGYYR